MTDKNARTANKRFAVMRVSPAESPVGLSRGHTRTNIRVAPHYGKPPDVVRNPPTV